MSYYFVSMKMNSRSKGGSSLRRSAYINCDASQDYITDENFDYSSKSAELMHAEIMLPLGVDPAFNNRDHLWTEVEKKENRSNSQLCRTFEISIPNEVPPELRADFARHLLQPFVDKGLPVEFAIHQVDAIFENVENPHISASVGLRQIDENGWNSHKERTLNNVLRDDPHNKIWVPTMNQFFEQHGIDAKVKFENNEMPIASPKIRRMAKRVFELGEAKVEKLPAALQRFIDAREQHLQSLEKKIDVASEIENLAAPQFKAPTPPSIKEKKDGRRDHAADDRLSRAGISRTERTIEPKSNRSDPSDKGRHVGDFGLTTNSRSKERGSHGRIHGTNSRSPAADRRENVINNDASQHLRRTAADRFRNRTLAQKIRQNHIANKMLKRLNPVSMKNHDTMAKPVNLLRKLKRAAIAKRVLPRLDRISETTLQVSDTAKLLQKNKRNRAAIKGNKLLDQLDKKIKEKTNVAASKRDATATLRKLKRAKAAQSGNKLLDQIDKKIETRQQPQEKIIEKPEPKVEAKAKAPTKPTLAKAKSVKAKKPGTKDKGSTSGGGSDNTQSELNYQTLDNKGGADAVRSYLQNWASNWKKITQIETVFQKYKAPKPKKTEELARKTKPKHPRVKQHRRDVANRKKGLDVTTYMTKKLEQKNSLQVSDQHEQDSRTDLKLAMSALTVGYTDAQVLRGLETKSKLVNQSDNDTIKYRKKSLSVNDYLEDRLAQAYVFLEKKKAEQDKKKGIKRDKKALALREEKRLRRKDKRIAKRCDTLDKRLQKEEEKKVSSAKQQAQAQRLKRENRRTRKPRLADQLREKESEKLKNIPDNDVIDEHDFSASRSFTPKI